ncbi:hypothetical protein [Paenibacillus thiaminolyticus]|uniref:hypothetical protein n=1 Tax=Paenibacillus thiaminolyticus TaxID=49283 RepID=UPI003D2DD7CC
MPGRGALLFVYVLNFFDWSLQNLSGRPARRFGLIQGMLFSPHIISLVSISFLWLWMMDLPYGLLFSLLLLALMIPSQVVFLPIYVQMTGGI